MPNAPAEGYQLKDISPRAFQHPADRAATAALGSIPYLDTRRTQADRAGYERALRQSYLGSSVRLSEQQLGEVWREHALAYATLDMPDVPDLYLTQFPAPNALAIGASDRSWWCSPSSFTARRSPATGGVRARGRAHPRRAPALPHRADDPRAADAQRASAAAAGPGALGVMEWGRATELSADRAAALVTRDPLACVAR